MINSCVLTLQIQPVAANINKLILCKHMYP